MAREFNLTTQKQEFLKECYVKEILTRFHWRHQHGQNLPSLAKPKCNTAKPKTKNRFSLPTIPNASSCGNKNEEAAEGIHTNAQRVTDNGEVDDEEGADINDSLMRPASPRTQRLLYFGTSKEEEGRYRYMKTRNNLKPQDKYSYPLITSFEYGWHIGNIADNQSSVFRRCRIVRDTFFRKNGIPTDPDPKDMAL
ncbi:protein SPMIP1 [Hyperolius riggenbachi]|uniref:protein SPMIP1 n=1 Tax=Hyperolius riggenbachi TaxID=752182 RepID=UPI0035A30B8B